jgi:hypothetical protein
LTANTGRLHHPGPRALPGCTPGQGPFLTVLPPLLLFGLLTLAGAWSWRWLAPGIQKIFAYPFQNPAAPPASASVSAPLSQIFTPEVARWSADIQRWSKASGLDPNLVAVVMQIESCGDPLALSPSGAAGLFQVMPYHFDLSEDPFDPDTNARRGLAYFAGGLELAHGNPGLALAGYNGGHGLIPTSAHAWPLQTQDYVAWGSGLLNDIASHRVPSPTLDRWLAAGGLSLCHAADVDIAQVAN